MKWSDLATSLVLLATLSAPCALGQGTRLWSQSHYDEFEKGTLKGVAVANEGYLEAGPTVKTIASTGSTYVWSLSADTQGDVFAGTGSPATIVQVMPDGKQTRLFESKDLSVQVVRFGPDGLVYAATLPSGKVYRLHPGSAVQDEGKAEVVFDPSQVENKPKYIWDMAFDEQGRLYIATGGPAAIYRVTIGSTAGKPEKFFTSDEQQVRCLLFEKDGSLVAGSDNGGLVYRIGKDGKGYVIYDAPKAEITALAESADGRLYVAAVGDKNKNGLPPLPVQGNVSVTATITIVQPGSIQASNSNGLIPEGSEIYEINRDGAPRKLWSTRDDVIYALTVKPEGLLAATGNRGHIYRIQENGSYADIAHAEASQVVAFAPTARGLYMGASNGGKVLWLGEDAAAEHTYESMVFDAGFYSKIGRPDVDAAKDASYDLFVRTGNVENPVRGWGEWQKVAPGAADAGSTSARFVQRKLALHKGMVDAVGIHYLPVNVPPAVDEIVVAPGARVNSQALQQPVPQQVSINLQSAQNSNFLNLGEGANGPLPGIKDKSAVTARWAAHDDNGDDLSYRVYFKGEDEKNWLLLRDRTRERFVTFDAIHIPDGVYRLCVVASDAPSHTPGEAKSGERVSDRFTIDTTPPAISGMVAQTTGTSGKVHVSLVAKDALSTIDRAEYSIDAGRWMYVEPTGKLSDAKEERYDFNATIPSQADREDDADVSNDAADSSKAPPAKEHVITVRVYDRYGNVTAEKALVR